MQNRAKKSSESFTRDFLEQDDENKIASQLSKFQGIQKQSLYRKEFCGFENGTW